METVKKLTRKEKIASGQPKKLSGLQRKKAAADARKEARKTQYYASLRNFPTSPRKMRYVADQIRGLDVEKALAILKLSPRHNAEPLRKLVLAAMDSYSQKSGERMDTPGLYVKTINVDSAVQLKRLRPAPQGRAHRIRKRSNHVTVVLDIRNPEEMKEKKAPKAKSTEKANTDKTTK